MYFAIMIICNTLEELNTQLDVYKKLVSTIGFVPTMGALHAGHICLIKAAALHNDVVVCSLFVNPTQFNNPADYNKYPSTLVKDIELLQQNGCTLLFAPTVLTMYPKGLQALATYNLGYIETVYDGAYRPGHFQGVCTVVQRLFEMVQPNTAYFGLKDYQQCMVIKKLVQLMQWEHKLHLHLQPTLRETDGLAMSSRNMRLTQQQRKQAPIVYQQLQYIKNNIAANNIEIVIAKAKHEITNGGFKIDYLDIAHSSTLAPITNWKVSQQMVCLFAGHIGEVRLIDNIVMEYDVA